MALRFTCPSCGRTQERISNRLLGKRIQCHCGQVVRLGPKQERGPAAAVDDAGNYVDAVSAHSIEPNKKPSLPEFAPPPETVERMFGKRPPPPKTLHDTPPLNPVGGREDPFRDGVEPKALTARPQAEEMLFPPLDVPVPVTPVVVPLPYEYIAQPIPITAYLGLTGGLLGMLQGVLAGLLSLYLLLRLSSLWNALGQDYLALTPTIQDAIRHQLLIDAGLLGILLLLNIGLAIASGMQMTAGTFEVRREVQNSRQASVNSALVCGLYLALLAVLAVLYYFTESSEASQLPLLFTRESLFGSFITVMLFLACLALLPTLLVGLGAARSTER